VFTFLWKITHPEEGLTCKMEKIYQCKNQKAGSQQGIAIYFQANWNKALKKAERT